MSDDQNSGDIVEEVTPRSEKPFATKTRPDDVVRSLLAIVLAGALVALTLAAVVGWLAGWRPAEELTDVSALLAPLATLTAAVVTYYFASGD